MANLTLELVCISANARQVWFLLSSDTIYELVKLCNIIWNLPSFQNNISVQLVYLLKK